MAHRKGTAETQGDFGAAWLEYMLYVPREEHTLLLYAIEGVLPP